MKQNVLLADCAVFFYLQSFTLLFVRLDSDWSIKVCSCQICQIDLWQLIASKISLRLHNICMCVLCIYVNALTYMCIYLKNMQFIFTYKSYNT